MMGLLFIKHGVTLIDLVLIMLTGFVMLYSLWRGMSGFWYIFNVSYMLLNVLGLLGNLYLLSNNILYGKLAPTL